MKLIDADELRRKLLAACPSPPGLIIRLIDAAPTVEAPQPLTRDDVLAEVARIEAAGDTAAVEFLDTFTGEWSRLRNSAAWCSNPDVPRWNVRVRAVPAATETVPLHEVIGRTPVGHNIPVRTVQYRRNPDGWIWDGGGEHCGSHLAVNADGLVTVLKGEA